MSPRQAAIAAGTKTYHGSPCAKCGGTERQTDSGSCKPCHRANADAWRRANRERVRENERKRRAANAEERRTKDRARYAANPEHFRSKSRISMRKRRLANPEKFREIDLIRYPAEADRRKTYARIYGVEWRKANPEKDRERYNRYRSRGKTASPRWLKASGQLDEIAAFYRHAIALGMEVDHACPLAGCRICGVVGLHVLANLQLLPRAMNKAKGNLCMDCYALRLRNGPGKAD